MTSGSSESVAIGIWSSLSRGKIRSTSAGQPHLVETAGQPNLATLRSTFRPYETLESRRIGFRRSETVDHFEAKREQLKKVSMPFTRTQRSKSAAACLSVFQIARERLKITPCETDGVKLAHARQSRPDCAPHFQVIFR